MEIALSKLDSELIVLALIVFAINSPFKHMLYRWLGCPPIPIAKGVEVIKRSRWCRGDGGHEE